VSTVSPRHLGLKFAPWGNVKTNQSNEYKIFLSSSNYLSASVRAVTAAATVTIYLAPFKTLLYWVESRKYKYAYVRMAPRSDCYRTCSYSTMDHASMLVHNRPVYLFNLTNADNHSSLSSVCKTRSTTIRELLQTHQATNKPKTDCWYKRCHRIVEWQSSSESCSLRKWRLARRCCLCHLTNINSIVIIIIGTRWSTMSIFVIITIIIVRHYIVLHLFSQHDSRHIQHFLRVPDWFMETV
jgi:hypothetical protein